MSEGAPTLDAGKLFANHWPGKGLAEDMPNQLGGKVETPPLAAILSNTQTAVIIADAGQDLCQPQASSAIRTPSGPRTCLLSGPATSMAQC